MFIPRHAHWAIPFGAVVLTFGINQQVLGGGFHLDYFLTVQLPVAMIAREYAYYLSKAGVAYQNYVTGVQTPKPQETKNEVVDWHTGNVLNDGFVPLKVDGKYTGNLVYTQVTEAPKFDAERAVARTLIDMRNHNLKIRMDESYWIKEKHFAGSREQFVAMLDKWEYHGLSGREGGQGKRVPKDWRGIRLVAQGNPLPPPPRKVL